jgi:two-component system, cell cycle sensor histidine kinase and response regulator CckA
MNRDPLRVLNLEADPEDHALIRREAAKTGLNLSFERAANRSEFEAALKRGNIDLILADHCVPGYDGMAALESALLGLPGVPYIIVSDSVGEDRVAESLSAGASGFVHKDRLERLPAAILKHASKTDKSGHRLEVEEMFREMADNIRDVFWVCAAETGKVLYVSPAYEGIWGNSPDKLFSEHGCWPGSVLDEDHAALTEMRLKLSQLAPFEVEYRIRRPDATVRWIHDRGYPVSGKVGSPTRMVGVAADITERKRLETDLLQAQKMELVGKLAGGIAHDFNNLLTIISGYVSMLLDKENLSAGSNEALKRVFTASRQATGLVRQLLIFSRKRSPKREIIDLNTEVEIITTMLRRLLGETITVDFEAAAESPRINADIGMLEQVLMNLAVNARDAMGRGGLLSITVGIRARKSAPQPGASARSGDFAIVTVRDTGAGIPASILPRIFEPFFTTKDEGRGTGLGLATAKDIVTGHDGWIDVETEPGVGTAFKIYLPLTRAEVPADPEPDPTREPKTGKGTILLVEDETNVREFAAAVLQQDGYTLLQAKSGESALEVWKWHSARIDLLLTDVVLPGEYSGPQLGALFQGEKPSLKLILTTGYSREAVATIEGKSFFVLSKPYTPRTLLQAVHEVLRPGDRLT